MSCKDFTTDWSEWRGKWQEAALTGAKKGLEEFNDNMIHALDVALNVSSRISNYADNAAKSVRKFYYSLHNRN